MVEGGDKHDLRGILMGFAKLDGYSSEGGEGESDRSLLVSLLSSGNMMRLRILFFAGTTRARLVLSTSGVLDSTVSEYLRVRYQCGRHPREGLVI